MRYFSLCILYTKKRKNTSVFGNFGGLDINVTLKRICMCYFYQEAVKIRTIQVSKRLYARPPLIRRAERDRLPPQKEEEAVTAGDR